MATELERRALLELLNAIEADGRVRGSLVYDKVLAARAIASALQQAQQPGAQAVAKPILWVHPMLLGGAPLAVECSTMRLARAQIPLYTAPPPLPEVSEEDVHNALTKWSRLGLTTRVEPHARMRTALESYRARLAAKGGV